MTVEVTVVRAIGANLLISTHSVTVVEPAKQVQSTTPQMPIIDVIALRDVMSLADFRGVVARHNGMLH